MKIGVLALQGAFAEHVSTLRAIGVEAVEVRLPEDLADVDGLIIPGGESTTMRRLIERWGLRQPILDLAESGAPLFGTCAGMIVLSTDITSGEDPVLPLLDVSVEHHFNRDNLLNLYVGHVFGGGVQKNIYPGSPANWIFLDYSVRFGGE